MKHKTLSVLTAATIALSVLIPTASANEIISFASVSNAPAVSNSFSGKIDIGGYSLNVNIKGEIQEDRPTVIFESGYGDDSSVWATIAQQISQYTRTVTYDRAGVGLSDSDPNGGFTSKDAAERLHKLVAALKVDGPLVLVGHSLAGLHMREYQYLYPDDVKGIVFVDVSHEHMEDTLFSEFPVEVRKEIVSEDFRQMNFIEGNIDDALISYSQIDIATQADSLRNVPITVLSGGNHHYPASFPVAPELLEQRWGLLQTDLASMSDESLHVVDPQNGHRLHEQNPQLIIDNVISLLERL
ncbi:alpha/beta hydrolase [Paenibacillus sp. SYP-B3998]|uniref:Alpha/beta hydrolase n=1 Tax=Paenibacillus sp. SYP-B3998 TaxID=2678564 RepID=A0A6G3ZUP5_9BACL|nr:alpha/beta hydrolase [Paenibacillus sp. SYP-B3998]NEW05790.1 alpha/beta hydrolase [Paenibacillus sp. SYP-B3998]